MSSAKFLFSMSLILETLISNLVYLFEGLFNRF